MRVVEGKGEGGGGVEGVVRGGAGGLRKRGMVTVGRLRLIVMPRPGPRYPR